MTVAELIEKLKDLPQDQEIFAHEFDYAFGTYATEIDGVSEWIVDKDNVIRHKLSKKHKKILVIE